MSTSQRSSVKYLVFDGTTTGNANGVSKAFFCDDFRNAVIEVTASNPVNLVMKVPASNFNNNETTSLADAYPDFSAADSMTNPWTYVQMIDLSTGTPYNGATGYTFSTAGTKEFEVNINQKRWIGIEISGRVSGSIKVTISLTDNR